MHVRKPLLAPATSCPSHVGCAEPWLCSRSVSLTGPYPLLTAFALWAGTQNVCKRHVAQCLIAPRQQLALNGHKLPIMPRHASDPACILIPKHLQLWTSEC